MKTETSSEKMTTLSAVLNQATENGYNLNFSIGDKQLLWDGTDKHYDPEEVIIDNFYRFEGESDPADNTILYLLQTKSEGRKGTLTDAYGVYGDNNVSEFIRRVKEIHKQQHQVKTKRQVTLKFWHTVTCVTLIALLFGAVKRKAIK